MAIATTEQKVWQPHPGQQTRFLASPAFEALFGGAAGPGKTECIVMEALRQVNNPKYTAAIFRRTFPMLEAAHGIIQRSREWYPVYGGEYNAQKHVWTFPSGAMIYFGHMQYRKDMYNYQGAEFCFIGFDELTEFEQDMYLYMFTRCRAPAPGLRAYIRVASNPGNVGHQWVKQRFITRDIVNRVRYFASLEGADVEVSREHPDALSRVFYPGTLGDNPDADPNYRQRIRASGDPVLIAQLEHGDWDVERKEGLIYPNWSLENIGDQAEYNPDLPLWWACDDGYTHGDGPGHANYHPRVILFMQPDGIGGVNVIDEDYCTGETHDETIRRALNLDYKKPEAAWVDGSAPLFRGEIAKHGINTFNGSHKVSDGIKKTRQLICDGFGVRRVHAHPRCQQFIRDMGSYSSDVRRGAAKEGELVPLKIDDHGPDALRYGTYHNLRVAV